MAPLFVNMFTVCAMQVRVYIIYLSMLFVFLMLLVRVLTFYGVNLRSKRSDFCLNSFVCSDFTGPAEAMRHWSGEVINYSLPHPLQLITCSLRSTNLLRPVRTKYQSHRRRRASSWPGFASFGLASLLGVGVQIVATICDPTVASAKGPTLRQQR